MADSQDYLAVALITSVIGAKIVEIFDALIQVGTQLLGLPSISPSYIIAEFSNMFDPDGAMIESSNPLTFIPQSALFIPVGFLATNYISKKYLGLGIERVESFYAAAFMPVVATLLNYKFFFANTIIGAPASVFGRGPSFFLFGLDEILFSLVVIGISLIAARFLSEFL